MNTTILLRPIIQSFKEYSDYTYEAIHPSTLALFEQISKDRYANRSRNRLPILLRSLEAVLQVTRRRLDFETIPASLNNETCRLFIGALNSDLFVIRSRETRYAKTQEFLSYLYAIQTTVPNISAPNLNPHKAYTTACIQRYVELFERYPLDEEKVWAWHGWACGTKMGNTMMLPLYPVYRRLGRAFTDSLHAACSVYAGSRRIGTISGLRSLTRFIGQYPSGLNESILRKSHFTSKFWREFFVYYATTAYADGKGSQPQHFLQIWRHVVRFIKECLIPSNLFAPPLGELPHSPMERVPGSKTRVMTTKDGHTVKTKLLTHVPLEVSDDQAMQLLFDQIQKDHDCFLQWARSEVSLMWKRYKRRIAFTKAMESEESANLWQSRSSETDRKQAYDVRNAAIVLNRKGYATWKELPLKHLFPRPLMRTAAELGLPIVDALLPHCIVLIASHPAITDSFLADFQLYDNEGNQAGFIEIDGGFYLVGFKYRRGAALAQLRIRLNEETTDIVRQLIVLTEPLREYLRRNNDKAWRYFLLSCKKGFSYPGRVGRFSQSPCMPNRVNKLAERLGTTWEASFETRHDLAKRFSLTAFRATAGVLVYLRTRSASKAAEALGHAYYDPDLMRHYLPDPILQFFQDRWIRIFQTGLIVEALKESDHLVEAAGFRTIDELHMFLNHHALKLFPDSKEGSNREATTKEEAEVVFGVNTAILTLLVSLMLAVQLANKPVCAKALYWAGLTKHLIEHIEVHLVHRADIQRFLKVARLEADPKSLKALIYE